MQQFRANLTRLRGKIAAKLPDTPDVFGYKGVTKAVLLKAVDSATELSQGILAQDETRFEVIALKRDGSRLYGLLKEFLDADNKKEVNEELFNDFLNSLSLLIEKTKLTYFIVAKNGIRDDQEVTKIRAIIAELSSLSGELKEKNTRVQEEFRQLDDVIAVIKSSYGNAKDGAIEIIGWHSDIAKQRSELAEIHGNIKGWDREIKKHTTQFQTLAKKTSGLFEDAASNNEKINTQFEDCKKIRSSLELSVTEHNKFLTLIKDTLGDANKVSMAASFKARKDELSRQQISWQIIFVATMIAILFVVSQYILPKLQSDSPIELLKELAIASPLVWLGWFAAKQYGYTSKIREDYAFKSAAAMAYEGHKKAARDADKNLESVLLEFSLYNMAKNPIRLYGDGEIHASPLHEFFDKSIGKLGRYNKIKFAVPSVGSVEAEKDTAKVKPQSSGSLSED